MSATERTVVRPARPEVTVPEWMVVNAMDDHRRSEERSRERHDTWAQELGFGRKRIEQVEVGDILRLTFTWREVARKEERVTPDGDSWWEVWYADGAGPERFEPGMFVSYQVDAQEPF